MSRLPLVFVILAILLVGADPTPSFLGVASPAEASQPTPPDRPAASGFLLPVSVAVAASVPHEASKTAAPIHFAPVAAVAAPRLAPPSSPERLGPCALAASDASFGSSIRLRC